MKFAFSTLGCPDWSVKQAVDTAAKLGYDGIEIRGVNRQWDLSKTPDFSAEGISKTKKLFKDAGVPIASIDASASFCWPDDAKQEEALAEALRHVDIAVEMGAPQVRVFGGNIPEGESMEKWAPILAGYLKRLGEAAAGKGIVIALETHDSWRRSSEVMPVIRMADCSNVKVLWDVAHPFKAGESIEESEKGFAGHVVHVHTKDEAADGTLVMLGEGEYPLLDAFKALKRMKFNGYVSIEWEKAWHPEIEDPEVALPQAIEYMKRLDAES